MFSFFNEYLSSGALHSKAIKYFLVHDIISPKFFLFDFVEKNCVLVSSSVHKGA